MTRKSTASKMVRLSAAGVGILVCATFHTLQAADGDFADALSAGAPLDRNLRAALSGAFPPVQRTANFDETRGRIDDPALASFGRNATLPAVLTASVSARGQVRALAAQYRPAGGSPDLVSPIYRSLSDFPARFRYVLGSDPPLASDRARQSECEVFLRNPDPLVRAKVRVSLGKEWLFVYADMGAGASPLRWQGLVGIRVAQDAHLLGGWRRITYYFSPGGEFDSLDFDGPFIGAQRAW